MNPKKTFVEIGAADFDTLLPLAHNGWRGVIVEPVPYFAARLREYVSAEKLDVRVYEMAITTHNGTAMMYESMERDEEWTRGISHMVNQSGTKLLELAGNQHLTKRVINVRCQRLDTFIFDTACLQFEGIDLLKIDIEGHELDVLREYGFRLKPKMLKIEHKHCDDKALVRLLSAQGYHVWKETDDLYAVC